MRYYYYNLILYTHIGSNLPWKLIAKISGNSIVQTDSNVIQSRISTNDFS